MKAHKVPATYFDSWKISGTRHSIYIFNKSESNKSGQMKTYRKVKKITQEHSYFMEEDFYYVDVEKNPGMIYKLKKEVEEFLNEFNYNIEYCDMSIENEYLEDSIVKIKNYCDFIKYHDQIDSWIIKDDEGHNVDVSIFKNILNAFLFNKVGTIIEETYFANELEPKWNLIKAEIEMQRTPGDDFCLNHKNDFLEFFVIQYLRLDRVKEEYIEPVLEILRDELTSKGFDEYELNDFKEDGLLASESYFYGLLLDVARGNKSKINNFMKSIETNYVIDLIKSA